MPASAAITPKLEAMMTAVGPLLIIAGPGSDKTFTLIESVVFLLSEKVLTPEQIMVVKFTDKAAQELTTRSSKHMSEGSELQRLCCIEAHQMWHQNQYEDVFNGHLV
jgi:superfamily I DNA/RNA helicase